MSFYEQNQDNTVGIIGCGFVGNELIQTFSKVFKVLGYDINHELIDKRKHQYEQNQNVKFLYQHEYEQLQNAQIYCVAVPTLIDFETNKINDKPLLAVRQMLDNLLEGTENKIIVIESSCFVGMTRQLFSEFAKKHKAHVLHSAERYDPGRVQPSFHNTPKVIGGLQQEDVCRALYFYQKVFTTMVPVSNSETSEMSKLNENCQRILVVSYFNQIADNCKKFGVDPDELARVSATKPFGYLPVHSSLSQLAGNCLAVNANWFLYNNNLPLLESAVQYAQKRPIIKAHELIKNNPNMKRLLIVGVTFKKNYPGTYLAPVFNYVEQLKKENPNLDIDFVDDVVDEENIKQSNLHRVYSSSMLNHKDKLNYDYCVVIQKHTCMEEYIKNLKEHFGENRMTIF